MIGSLRGRVLDFDLAVGEVLIEVGGVGYLVTVSEQTARALPPVGGEAMIHIHHHIREDGQKLYGFTDLEQRRMFEALLGAHGVGPALALSIMSTHSPDRLRLAVATDDVDALCQVPGVGKKTAARLLIELKNRLGVPADAEALVAAATSVAEPEAGAAADVREALAGLGYSPEETRRVLAGIVDDGDASAMLRRALRQLGGS
ncbi:MAG TPA: Holliday junction branch migration protein RuvA [Acidimicrobiales bacterium]|nr:Holliday junction branch migration protein RuvA [Acidimicrobiales bacterium]